MRTLLLSVPLLLTSLAARAQGQAARLKRAAEPVPPGPEEEVRSDAASRFEGASGTPAVPAGDPLQTVQKAGAAGRQAQTVPAGGGQPVIVVQNQNINDNALNADKAGSSSKSLWWALIIGAGLGAAIGGAAGGWALAVLGALIGAIVALVLHLWNRQA